MGTKNCAGVSLLTSEWSATHRLDAAGASPDDQLGHDDGMSRRPAKSADPPLERSERGRVEDELALLRVIGGSRLESLDVAAMTELGLGVAADDLEGLGGLEESLLLLVGRLAAERLEEHALVQAVWSGKVDKPFGHESVIAVPVELLRDLL
jgi:hypothetical protein